MPRIANELSARDIKALKYEGVASRPDGLPVFKPVGGVAGLLLQLTATGGRSWILRYSIAGKRRSMGLGPYPEVGVAEARQISREAKALVREGLDPLEERRARRAAKAAEANRLTFAQCVDGWEREHPHKFSSEKHRAAWLASVRGLDGLQSVPVADITEELVWSVLEPVALKTADTARRLRGRIAAVLDWAEDEKHREAPNPAATGWIKRRLANRTAGTKTSHRPAAQAADAPRLMGHLRAMEGVKARMVEFIALTAARSGEVRFATWDEVDLEAAVWRVPAARMKMDRDHEVPLSGPALELLKALPRISDTVFPAPHGGPYSDVIPTNVLQAAHERDLAAGDPGFIDQQTGKRATAHGLRSTFRDWAGENGFPREHAELALAHKFGNEVEQAYQRSIYTEQRRPMMEAWAAFLGDEQAQDNVVKLRS